MISVVGYFLRMGLAWLIVAASLRIAPARVRRCLHDTVARGLRWPAIVLMPIVAAGILCLVLNHGFPLPRYHDEFSYLLGADTFAHGRLANPAPRLWPAFETFHVNVQPTYVSMYQPGQGLTLALGQVLLGQPWFGVWLTAMACAWSARWAARAWINRRWATVAGLVTAVVVASGYWVSSYWGGALAATGGALVLGGTGRILSRSRPATRRDGIMLAAGVAVLLYTRPYEGLALLVPLVILIVAERRVAATWCLPALMLFLLAAGWLLFYNHQTTGSLWRTPYTENRAAYHALKLFVFEDDRQPPPVYRHRMIERLYREGYALKPFSREAWTKSQLPTLVFFGAGLQTLVLLLLPWLWKVRRTRGVMYATAGVVVAMLLTVWNRPHYFAPALVGFAILATQALRLLSTWRWEGRRFGGRWVTAALASWLLAAGALGVHALWGLGAVPAWVARRAAIVETLQHQGGRHLLLVRYRENHDPNEGWVYNGADLGPAATVLWARKMDDAADRRLMKEYAGRSVWIVDADEGGKLTPMADQVVAGTGR